MFEDHRRVRHILPDKEVGVFANRIIDKSVSELRFAGTSVFVNHMTCRSKETFPAPLPRLVRNIGVFDVKRSVETVKTPDRPKFLPIYGTRSTTRPEDRKSIEVLVARLDIIVPEVKKTS